MTKKFLQNSKYEHCQKTKDLRTLLRSPLFNGWKILTKGYLYP